MAIIVEDGSGIDNAESYVSVTEANQYWGNRSNTEWVSSSVGQKEAALREATQYLDVSYRWKGVQAYGDQALSWPRYDVISDEGYEVASDIIPERLKQAQCELALEALKGRLLPVADRGGEIKREQVGDLEIEYFEGAPGNRSYDFVTRLLAPYLSQAVGGFAVKLNRV